MSNLEKEQRDQIQAVLDKEYWAGMWDALTMDRNINCPICKKRLKIPLDRRRYETLSDHVCNPNAISPQRAYYKCDCEGAKEIFWDLAGYVYGKVPFRKAGSYSAIGSFARKMDDQDARQRLYQKLHIYGLISTIHAWYFDLKCFITRKIRNRRNNEA